MDGHPEMVRSTTKTNDEHRKFALGDIGCGLEANLATTTWPAESVSRKSNGGAGKPDASHTAP